MLEHPEAMLAEQLAAEYGDVVPAELIATMVSAASRDVARHGEVTVDEMARADVTALAAAVSRRSTVSSAA